MSQPIPPSAADWANYFGFCFSIGLAAGALVVGLMTYLVVKNRFKKGKPEITFESSGRPPAREAVTFAAISTILLFSLAVGAYNLTTYVQYPPAISESLVIGVTAFQWNFKFHYPNNVTTVGECRIPADKPIVFNVTSSDVMHDFGLPAFRVKIDAIAGRYNIVWITVPLFTGSANITYQIRCYELCGVGHTYMIASLIAMQPGDFAIWYAQTGNMTRTGSNMTTPGV